MSVDTRTPRTPTGDRSSGFDDAPALSMVKVPSDPAQVIVNHASFRVQAAAPRPRARSMRRGAPAASRDARRRYVAPPPAPAAGPRRVERPHEPGDRAAPAPPGRAGRPRRPNGPPGRRTAAATTARSLPPADHSDPGPRPDLGTVGHPSEPRRPRDGSAQTACRTRHRGRTRRTGRPGPHCGDQPHAPRRTAMTGPGGAPERDAARRPRYPPKQPRSRRRPRPARLLPGRRMNLGVVLLRCGSSSASSPIYAGMGKLCDPVYFDGGERGSMVTLAGPCTPGHSPSRCATFALHHPVGPGCVVAFLQVIVGVLTVLGLLAAAPPRSGALLSAALLVTVSWKTVPAYDTPDIIYLAAWSPLIIAGAPVYSLDGRLAGEAWRTARTPRRHLAAARRRYCAAGTVMATVVCGLTLLIGSLLGGAVRSTAVDVPEAGRGAHATNCPAPRSRSPGTRARPHQPPQAGLPAGSAASTGRRARGTAHRRHAGGPRHHGTGGAPSPTRGSDRSRHPPASPSPPDRRPARRIRPRAAPQTDGAQPAARRRAARRRPHRLLLACRARTVRPGRTSCSGRPRK